MPTVVQVRTVAAFVPVLRVFELIGIHSNTGYRLIKDGEFPLDIVQIGKRYFCHTADVEAFTHGGPSPA